MKSIVNTQRISMVTKKFKCSVSNYGLEIVYKGFETHNSLCKKCEVELHHPLGVCFGVCTSCANKSYTVRWNHINSLISLGELSFSVSAISLGKLKESLHKKLVSKKVLYENWTEESVVDKGLKYRGRSSELDNKKQTPPK